MDTNTWTCQIILTSDEGSSVPQGLAFRWMEVILESGGTLRPLPNGASTATWRGVSTYAGRTPAPLLASWAIRDATDRFNASHRAEGKPPLRLTLLLHGPELCDAVEGPIHARRLHGLLSLTQSTTSLRLSDQAATRVGSTFVLRKLDKGHEALGPRRPSASRVEVSIPALPAAREPAPTPVNRAPHRGPVEIQAEVSWVPTPGSNDRTREFTLIAKPVSRAA
ncbi:MAG TPA: hypothetical protein VM598_11985 [Bdellovibrionota bacterium]|nr:hypothetical protein [Bdellovibrionota bacterium]